MEEYLENVKNLIKALDEGKITPEECWERIAVEVSTWSMVTDTEI